MWNIQLITLYCTVCQYYSSKLEPLVQRLSNNRRPQFTDEEIITVYLWGIIQRRFDVKAIYRYTQMHLLDWFPNLPSYQAFNHRLCELAPAFEALSAVLIESRSNTLTKHTLIVDSMPVMLAKGTRASHGKVASRVCSKTYCSSKDEWYYGLKLHVLGDKRVGRLPFPVSVCASTASDHDLPVAVQMVEMLNLHDCKLVADKAYCDTVWKQSLLHAHDVTLITPRKKVRGQVDVFSGGDTASTSVSRMRQPIESFFNWLNEKTGIQIACKVRSLKGLLIHVFGRLAAALAYICFGFNS